MKIIIQYLLSLFILFSSVDLSAINLLTSCTFTSTESIAISDVMKVQYNLLQQTKNIVSNACDSIAKEVTILLSPSQPNTIFFDKIEISSYIYKYNYINYLKKFILVSSTSNDTAIIRNTTLILFFFGFIFLFILRYLGLLFTFGKIININQYRKAYSM